MDLVSIIAIAILTEALIEYAKTVIDSFDSKDYKTFKTQLASIVLGVAMSFAFGINAFATGFTVNQLLAQPLLVLLSVVALTTQVTCSVS